MSHIVLQVPALALRLLLTFTVLTGAFLAWLVLLTVLAGATLVGDVGRAIRLTRPPRPQGCEPVL